MQLIIISKLLKLNLENQCVVTSDNSDALSKKKWLRYRLNNWNFEKMAFKSWWNDVSSKSWLLAEREFFPGAPRKDRMSLDAI